MKHKDKLDRIKQICENAEGRFLTKEEENEIEYCESFFKVSRFTSDDIEGINNWKLEIENNEPTTEV